MIWHFAQISQPKNLQKMQNEKMKSYFIVVVYVVVIVFALGFFQQIKALFSCFHLFNFKLKNKL